jgi:steroid delta-isomerase-like uncharacterized protein
MLGKSSPRGRNVVLAAAVLLAVAAAALLSGTAASPASGGTNAEDTSARKAQAASYAADRRPVPRVVREWAAAWNTGDPERMAGLFTEDGAYEDHAFQVVFRGKDGIAQWVSITTGAIDDTHVEVTEAFRSGDRIAVQWTFSGKDTAGGLGGQPPTGESFSVPAASVFEMEGNKIRRVDDYYNLADLQRQLGLPSGAYVPPPAS